VTPAAREVKTVCIELKQPDLGQRAAPQFRMEGLATGRSRVMRNDRAAGNAMPVIESVPRMDLIR
jgi:hypothetical protein